MGKKSVKLYTPENMLESFYAAIRANRLRELHIPHSSVFYIRAKIEADTVHHDGQGERVQHTEV